MLKKYVKITRPNAGPGGYIQPIDKMSEAFEAETDGILENWEVGDTLQFELIEMEEEKYKHLPEFCGW